MVSSNCEIAYIYQFLSIDKANSMPNINTLNLLTFIAKPQLLFRLKLKHFS